MCCWVKVVTDRNDYTYWLGADDGSSGWWSIGNWNDGLGFHPSYTGGDTATALSTTVGDWFFVAMVYDPAGTDTIYWAAEGAGSLSSTTATLTGLNDAWTFLIGNDGFNEWLNGEIAAVKVWTAALSGAELLDEFGAADPVRTSNLWANYHFWDGPDTADQSGNSRTLTANGSPAAGADNPAIDAPSSGGVTGSGTITEADDTVAGTGDYTPAPISGSGAITEGADDATGSGTFDAPGNAGSGAITEGADTVAGVGDYTPVPITGSGAITEADDTVAGVGEWTPEAVGLFPVAVSADGHYFIDQNDDPWFGIGDTAWSLPATLTSAEVETYLDDRQAKGFNLVLFSAPEHTFTDNSPAYRNENGDDPFTGTAFQSSTNDAYWDFVEFVVQEAGERGITCLICPAYLGFDGSDEGWDDEIVAATNADMTAYGDELATRFAGYQNIMWLIGHDKTPDATEIAREAALTTALRSGTDHLIGPGGDNVELGSETWAGSGITWDFDTVYDRNTPQPVGYMETGYGNDIPVGWFESLYEDDGAIAASSLRNLNYSSLTAGGSYTIFGNNPIWHFNSPSWDSGGPQPWPDALDSQGSLDVAVFAALVTTLAGSWAAMAPDLTNTFLTTGEGSGTTHASARFDTVSTTGVVALCYRPDGGSATLEFDLTELAPASVLVKKYDPVDGSFTDINTYATTGTQSIGSLGTNSGGDGDWLLVFEAVPDTSVTGSGAITEGADDATGVGDSDPPLFSATGAITEAADDATGVGDFDVPEYVGSGAVTEGDDTVAGVGDYTPIPITGTGTVTEGDDVAAGVGAFLSQNRVGSGAMVEAGDDATGVGDWTGIATVSTWDNYGQLPPPLTTRPTVNNGGYIAWRKRLLERRFRPRGI